MATFNYFKDTKMTILPENRLILITANSNLISTFDDFQYPDAGEFESSFDLCGLHNGEGNPEVIDFNSMKWLVLSVNVKDLDFSANEFVTFKKGSVVHCGDQRTATNYLYNSEGGDKYYIQGLLNGSEISNKIIKAGDNSIIVCGNNCIVIAGKNSDIWANYNSKVKVGHSSCITIEDTSTCNENCHVNGNRFPNCNYSKASIDGLDYYSVDVFYHKNGYKIEACDNLNNIEKYLSLESELHKILNENNYRESKEEDSILSKMEDVWWMLTEEERKLID